MQLELDNGNKDNGAASKVSKRQPLGFWQMHSSVKKTFRLMRSPSKRKTLGRYCFIQGKKFGPSWSPRLTSFWPPVQFFDPIFGHHNQQTLSYLIVVHRPTQLIYISDIYLFCDDYKRHSRPPSSLIAPFISEPNTPLAHRAKAWQNSGTELV